MEAAAPFSNELTMTVEDEGRVDAKELNLEATPMTASLEMSTGTTEAPKSVSLLCLIFPMIVSHGCI